MKLKKTDLFQQSSYINGRWQQAKNNQTFAVYNPSSQQNIGHVPLMGKLETEEAIQAAKQALPLWKALTAKERSHLLRRWYDLMLKHLDDLAILLTTEQGKPLEEAKAELRYAASFLEWFAEEAKRTYGDIIPSVVKNQRLLVIKQPVGVVGAITPWNFPSAMITRKCAPALAAGCTFIVKPAEATPFSALALAKLSEEAGIPPGVFNVITGNPETIGAEMTSHPDVRKITFTGSTKVGKLLLAQSASTVKKVTLELGGSAPFIVFADADLPSAIEGLIASKFRNCGQSCICADRIFVEKPIYDTFAKQLITAINHLKIGDGLEEGVKLGPLINEAAVEKIQRHVDDAIQKGAHLLHGGKVHPLGKTFYEPTVLTHVTPSMQVAQEESFGPIIPLIPFTSEEEVLEMANDTSYGLASYIYTQNHHRIWRFSEGLESGMVSVNSGLLSNEVAPFGGIKESGIGREGSKYGIEEYLEIKYICMN